VKQPYIPSFVEIQVGVVTSAGWSHREYTKIKWSSSSVFKGTCKKRQVILDSNFDIPQGPFPGGGSNSYWEINKPSFDLFKIISRKKMQVSLYITKAHCIKFSSKSKCEILEPEKRKNRENDLHVLGPSAYNILWNWKKKHFQELEWTICNIHNLFVMF